MDKPLILTFKIYDEKLIAKIMQMRKKKINLTRFFESILFNIVI